VRILRVCRFRSLRPTQCDKAVVKHLVYTETTHNSHITVKEQWLPKENTIYCLILPGNQCSNVKAEGFCHETVLCTRIFAILPRKKQAISRQTAYSWL